MRTEGAGKGDALRYGVDWKKYGENYDAIFRKNNKPKFRLPKLTESLKTRLMVRMIHGK